MLSKAPNICLCSFCLCRHFVTLYTIRILQTLCPSPPLDKGLGQMRRKRGLINVRSLTTQIWLGQYQQPQARKIYSTPLVLLPKMGWGISKHVCHRRRHNCTRTAFGEYSFGVVHCRCASSSTPCMLVVVVGEVHHSKHSHNAKQPLFWLLDHPLSHPVAFGEPH